jgi:hypothetical protein
MLVGLVVAIGFATPHAEMRSTCSERVAYAAVLQAGAPRRVRWIREGAMGRYLPSHAGRVEQLFCHDFTRDGRGDMVFSLDGGGTGAATAWLAFRRVGARWQLVAFRQNLSRLTLVRDGIDLLEWQPIFRIYPEVIGRVVRRFRWNGRALTVVSTRRLRGP